MKVPIEVSARHVHLTRGAFETLFGEGIELTIRNELSQPGTFAAEETITLKTEKGQITNVRILGPLRKYSQVEISKTDARLLGLNPPIRDTHELELAGTPGITLIGPKGSLKLGQGVIIAWRHIHMSPLEAVEAELKDGDLVKVDIDSDPRSVIFENVLVRLAPNFRLAMHIDTDEANAAGIEGGEIGKIIVGFLE